MNVSKRLVLRANGIEEAELPPADDADTDALDSVAEIPGCSRVEKEGSLLAPNPTIKRISREPGLPRRS